MEKDDNKLSEASGGSTDISKQIDLDNDGHGELENGVIDAVAADEKLFNWRD